MKIYAHKTLKANHELWYISYKKNRSDRGYKTIEKYVQDKSSLPTFARSSCTNLNKPNPKKLTSCNVANRSVIKKVKHLVALKIIYSYSCLLYTSPSPRDRQKSRMPSSA